MAAVRERASPTVQLAVATVGAVRALLAQRGGAWEQALSGERALRMALNQTMCSADTAIADGAEVAFFPPVTGG